MASSKEPSVEEERQGLMLRMPRELHRQLRHVSVDRGVPLNTMILQAIEEWWAHQPENREHAARDTKKAKAK